MRFVVISNVQGNATALHAVLDRVAQDVPNLDGIVCAGNLVGLGPQPNEVIDLFRLRGVSAVRGNYDDAVVVGRSESGSDLPDEAAARAETAALSWNREQLSPENRAYLEGLPRDLRLFPGSAGVRVEANTADDRQSEYRRNFLLRALFGGMVRPPVSTARRILVVHGSPRALNERVRSDTANSILASISREAQFDVLITGHAAMSFQREFGGATFIGVGPVSGQPNPPGEAQFAVLTTGESVTAEFETVPYDAQAHADVIAGLALPPSIATAFGV